MYTYINKKKNGFSFRPNHAKSMGHIDLGLRQFEAKMIVDTFRQLFKTP